MPRSRFGILLLVASASAAAPAPQGVEALLKPAVFKKVLNQREVAVHADLEEAGNDQEYALYSAMLVRAPPKRVKAVLTDFRLYERIIPYVDRASFDEKSRILKISGGLWKYKLSSSLRFQDRGASAMSFEVIQGHFLGMKGEVLFESRGEKGTLVYLHAGHRAKKWPPAFIVERGAEIVFGFTAKRMRNYMENPSSDQEGPNAHDPGIPQPENYRR